MALCSCQKAQQNSVRYSSLDELANFVQGIPIALNNVGPPDTSIPILAPIKYTKEDLQKITKLCMDLLLQGQGSRSEPAGHQEGP